MPIMVTYNISDMGYVKYYLAPKVVDEEDS